MPVLLSTLLKLYLPRLLKASFPLTNVFRAFETGAFCQDFLTCFDNNFGG
jgi:hypothetical protein